MDRGAGFPHHSAMSSSSLPPSLAAAVQRASLDGALQAILAHFGCQAGTIHLTDPAAPGLLRLAAHAGLPPNVVALVQSVPLGKGIAGLAAERREPITICNLQTDTSGQARPAARTTGMEGSIAVPMLSPAGALCGVLGIAKATAYDWPASETAQLLAVAAALSTSNVTPEPAG